METVPAPAKRTYGNPPVCVRFDPQITQTIDRLAEVRGCNRSDVVRDIVRAWIMGAPRSNGPVTSEQTA